jgi:Ca-activated chloride channel family protein
VAPVADGRYELVYFTGGEQEVLARVPITVTPFVGSVSAPDEVEAGTEFEVSWTGPDGPGDYISVLPAEATDWVNGPYFYTSSGRTGTLLAPIDAGDYLVWYIAGQERALMVSQPIAIRATAATVTGPAEVVAGTRFDASWTGPDGPGDYISILPAGAATWNNEAYFYTSGGSSGSLTAPLTEGPHEVVYITGHDRVILARRPITVTALEVSLRAPAVVARGSEFEVTWNGPDGSGDYVSILPAGSTEWTNEPYFYTSTGSPGTLTAPDAPGNYEVWYIYGSPRTFLESVSITVE